jgi:hypothetical protein
MKTPLCPRLLRFCLAGAAVAAGCTDKDAGRTSDTGSTFVTPDVVEEGRTVIACQVDDDCASVFPELATCRIAVCRPLEGVSQCVQEGAPNGTECADGKVCTGPDFCTNGQCGGGPRSCDDQDPCTLDSCDLKIPGGCVNKPASGNLCDDKNPCTALDTCDEGACIGGDKVDGCCLFSGECEDQDPCTEDECVENACAHPFGFAPCNDQNPCTTKDHCDGEGLCSGSGILCEDGNPCTADTCLPDTGSCQSDQAPDGTACEDGNPCTTPDLCSQGLCVALGSICDCTQDADCLSFEDGDLCNGTLRCKDFECSVDPLTVIGCNPAGDTPCVKNTCDPATSQCAPKAAADTTGCDDQNPCTESDACTAGLCFGADVTCDDDNPCTFDGCSPGGGCQFVPHTQLCDDGSKCTGNDKCKNGACAGVVLNCDDGDPCTTEPCSPQTGCSTVPNNAACNDGNPCTQGDICTQGSCIPGVNTCQCVTDGDCLDVEDGDFCNGTLRCVDHTCQVDQTTLAVCNQAADTACLKNSCIPESGLCVPMPLQEGLVCDDGNPCTNDDACKSGLCLGSLVSCNDGNPCSFDACSPALGCTYVPNNLPCDDADVCSDNDQCIAGYCVGQPLICNDFNPCTNDACSALSGCAFDPTTAPCEDGNPCTLGDLCEAASCVPGQNACQCTGDVDCESFEDENLCNGTLHCLANQCVVDDATVVSCNTTGDTTCAKTVCDPASGQCKQQPVQDAVPCNDKSACTVNDTCFKGACLGEQLDCKDDNGCTDDSCDPAAGCLNPANTAACLDGNACTSGDTCTAGICKGSPFICSDGNPCTEDGCAPATGCSYTAAGLGKPCDDGNACTGTDHCNSGSCAGTPIVCEDQNPCTADTCAQATGCAYSALDDLTPCDDQSTCTLADTCQAGVCTGSPLACDDADPCTTDGCAPASGCQYPLAPNGTACNDGEVCTTGDTCKSGVCDPGLLVCDCLSDAECAELEDGNLCNGTLYCAPDHTCQTDLGTVVTCDPSADTTCLANTCQSGTGACAMTAANQAKPCLDEDPCTQDELCVAGDCTGNPVDCDDAKPCTNDGCDPGAGCFHQDNTLACDDGSKCTVGDVCTAGSCAAAPKVCEDGNPCTADGCDPATGCTTPPATNGASCSDGNSCSSPDTCQTGACEGGPSVCQCLSNPDCAALEDGDACNGTLVCDLPSNTCKIDPATVKTCDTSGDTLCQKTVCEPSSGACIKQDTANGKPCGDGNACNGDEKCQSGSCADGTPLSCDDANGCTSDSCLPGSGCQYAAVPNGTTCADGDLCDGTETCQAGSCSSGTPLSCADGNLCTTDTCLPATGCKFTAVANDMPCADANLCNGAETCQGGTCSAGTPLVCNDANPCSSASCAPASGCSYQNVANGTPCPDGDLCDGTETCKTGLCKNGTPLACDDANTCTTDACDPATGCKATAVANGTSCADSNLCDGTESCQAGVCADGAALVCNDGSACTTDSCDPATGCKAAQVVNGTPCPDANACDGAETCQVGVCTDGAALVCNDSKVCTTDTCNPAVGCQNTPLPSGSSCADATVCNGAETCQAGNCVAGTTLACNDANLCTSDSCHPTNGCTYTSLANGTSCSDGEYCNGAEICQAGTCKDQVDPSCDDSNPCTLDTCTGGACQHGPAFDGQPCASDSNACTLDICQSGSCGHPQAATGTSCADDGNSCTDDYCTNGTCTHPKVANDLPCADEGNPCTYDSCQTGVCAHVSNDPAPINEGQCYPANSLTANTGKLIGTWQDCGVADQFSFAGNSKTGAIDSWSCADPNFLYDGANTGYEYTYIFVAPVTGTCTLFEYSEGVLIPGTLFGLLDWFILDGSGACGPAACIDYVWENKKNDPLCSGNNWCSYKSFAVTEGQVFYFTGDLYDGNKPKHEGYNYNSDWEVEVKCSAQDALLLFEDFTDAVCDGCVDTTNAPGACKSFDWHTIGGFADITTGYYLGQLAGNTLSGYNCGSTSSTLKFPTVTLPATATSCTLSFDLYMDLDPADDGDCINDILKVLLSIGGKTPISAPGTACPSTATNVNPIGAGTGKNSKTFTYDLSAYLGSTVQVMFEWFADAAANNGLGAILDNVQVSCTLP